MRHRNAGKQLSRNSSHRRAMLRNMVTSLFKHEQIETTDAKAKSIRPIAEKMITLAKQGDLHSRRQALSYMKDTAVTHRLFDELKNRFLDRQGGYIRIIKKNFRKGDGAPTSIVQLLSADSEKKNKIKNIVKPRETVSDTSEIKESVENTASDNVDEIAEAESIGELEKKDEEL